MYRQSGSSNSIQIMKDRRLVKKMLAGSDRAFNDFVNEYFPKLYRYAMQRLRDHQRVEDVVQEALANAARSIETFRGESTLLTWLIQICRHEISRHISREQQQADFMMSFASDDLLRAVIESIESVDENPEESVRRDELISLIQYALDQLPGRYAQALEMKYVEGRSSREIADRLAIGDQAAQSLLARARQAFREVSETAIYAYLGKNS